MKIQNLKLYVIAVILMVNLSCSEESVHPIDSLGFNKLISFSDQEEFMTDLKYTTSLEHSDLVKFEDSRGYKSYGRLAEEIYFSIDFDKLSDAEIEDIVSNNNEFLEIVEKDGERFLEIKLAENPRRYLVNKDRMYRVGNSVVKIFDDGEAYGSLDKTLELKRVKSLGEANQIEGISVISTGIANARDAYDCPEKEASSTNNRDRTKVWITRDWYSDYQTGTIWNVVTTIHARPYKKTLGIWYYAKRTIDVDWSFRMDYDHGQGDGEEYYYNNDSDSEYTYKFERPLGPPAKYGEPLFVHFGGYHVRADTPSTSAANITCNSHIVPSI